MKWLRTITVDQWAALTRDHPVRTGTPREQAQLLGLYLIAALVLIFTEYAVDDLWRLFPMDYRVGSADWLYWRKLGWVLGVAGGYIVPTGLYAWFVLGLSPRDLGLNTKGFLEHLPMYFGFFGIVLPLVAWFSGDPHFLKTYPLSGHAADKLPWLILWEVCYGIQFIGVEFFFRGFLLFGGLKLLGPYVVPAMVVPYCMLHFQKPWPEAVASIVAGTTLGIVALRTRSILAGICIHAAVAWSMDGAALYRNGHLARLLGW